MKRPDVQVKLTVVDWLMEVFTVAILIGMVGLLIGQYNNLPAIIPTHFDARGSVNGYGGKWTILLLAAVGIAIYVLTMLAVRFPTLMNYPIPISKKNHERQFLNAVSMLRVVKLLAAGLFLFLVYGILQNANQKSFSIGQYFLPIMLFALLGAVGYFLYRGFKLR